MKYGNNFLIALIVVAYNECGEVITGGFDYDKVADENPDAVLRIMYVVIDAVYGEFVKGLNNLFETPEAAMDAIDEYIENGEGYHYYEVEFDNGDVFCVCGIDEPSLDEAAEFLKPDLEESGAEKVVGVTEISYSYACDIYGTDDDNCVIFSHSLMDNPLTPYEVTLSNDSSYCIIGSREPTCEEAAEFLGDVLDEEDGAIITSVAPISAVEAIIDYETDIRDEELEIFG